MRKSIKKIAASLLAATMVLGSAVSAFGYTAEDGVITDVEDGEVVYLYAGAATNWGDGLTLESSAFTQVEGLADGVLSITVSVPGYTGENEWESRFSICGATYNEATGDETLGTWARQILGEPNYVPQSAYTCCSSIAFDSVTEATDITVYYDKRTATVYIKDAAGNDVDYTVAWMSNDRDEGVLTLDELAAMTFDDFVAGLSADRKAEITNIAEATTLTYAMFDGTYVSNLAGLKAYVNGGEDYVKADEPVVEDPTEAPTQAPTEAPTQAPTEAPTQAPTTASNQSTKTGDVAPVALMVVLFAAVAVVAVAAKKKEA